MKHSFIVFSNKRLKFVIFSCQFNFRRGKLSMYFLLYILCNLQKAKINIRPHVTQFLSELSEIFEIIIFTASHSCYANVIIDYLDPNRQFISYRFFRESCIQTQQGVYVKDLSIFYQRSLKDLIIIDNAPYSFCK